MMPSEKMIEDTLAKIETRLSHSDALSDEQRQELRDLVVKLRAEVASLSRTHAEQAESIAGFAERSTLEATREQKNPRLLELSLEGLGSSVEEFERSHPKLVQVVNAISQLLSNVGI